MTTSTSAEFLSLCQAQVQLLTKSLQASWSVIYLTEDLWAHGPEKLKPILVYPPQPNFYPQDFTYFLKGKNNPQPSLFLLPSDQTSLNNYLPNYSIEYNDFQDQKQLICPLIYQDSVLGLLITRRNDRHWNAQEIEQIQQIVNTLAIAGFLAQQKQWYQQQLINQERVVIQQEEELNTLLHQLKNPLTALRTFSKLLLKRFLPDNNNYPIAEGIFQETNRLQDLINNFQRDLKNQNALNLLLPPYTKSLPTASFLTGNALDLEEIDLTEIISNLLFAFQTIAEEKTIKIKDNLPIVKGKLKPIKGNSQALKEMISNLIDNALKYSPPSSQIYVELGLEKISENQQLQGIAIHDQGYGIPKEDLSHIFERHYRGEKAKTDIPGTGLGLAIVQELITKMGGKIEIYSPNLYFPITDDSGTTVILYLPMAEK